MRRSTVKSRKIVVIIGFVIGIFLISPMFQDSTSFIGNVYADQGFRIGFSNGFTGNIWRQAMLMELDVERQKQPEIKELIVLDGQGKIEKQVADIESLIAQKVDAIMVIPHSASALCSVLRKAGKAGIKVIVFNIEIECKDIWDAYLGCDPSPKGEWLGKMLTERLDGKGKIVGFGGIPGNMWSAAMWAGAKKSFDKSEIEVLTYKFANWQMDQGKIVMADLLNVYPQIDGIFSDGPEMAAGAVRAMLDAGRPLVPVATGAGNGMIRIFLEYREAQPNFDIFLISEPTREAAETLKLIIKILKGEDYPKKISVEPLKITRENCEKYFKPFAPDAFEVDTTLTDEQLKKLFEK